MNLCQVRCGDQQCRLPLYHNGWCRFGEEKMSKIEAIDKSAPDAALAAVQDILERGVPCIVVMGLGVDASGRQHVIIKSFGDTSSSTGVAMSMAAALLREESIAYFMDDQAEDDGPSAS